MNDKSTKVYPKGVVGVWDCNKSGDRYTVVYDPETDSRGRRYWSYIGMNSCPTHPSHGVGMHGELTQKPGKYLGKKINFQDLPEECQRVVLRDLAK